MRRDRVGDRSSVRPTVLGTPLEYVRLSGRPEPTSAPPEAELAEDEPVASQEDQTETLELINTEIAAPS